MDIVVLKSTDQESILAFERARAERVTADPIERELLSWKARWRPEELTHYLALGWSFGARIDGILVGYILTQPLLFFRGLTQTLWIEAIAYDDPEIGTQLLDSAYRWAKDKHFQSVLVSEMPVELKSNRKPGPIPDKIIEMPSSRWV